MFPSDDLLRALMNDREREVHERTRVRQAAPRHPIIRWRSGHSTVVRQAEKRGF